MTIKEENAVLVKPVNKYNIKKMQSRFSFILSILASLFCFCNNSYAQEITAEENNNPVILYSATPKKYEIGGIKVEGVKNYEDYGHCFFSFGYFISLYRSFWTQLAVTHHTNTNEYITRINAVQTRFCVRLDKATISIKIGRPVW